MRTVAELAPISEQQILEISSGSPASIAAWIESVSQARDITFRPRPSDVFARAASRLSDAEVEFDATEHLLLALERAGAITSIQRGLLQVSYLR